MPAVPELSLPKFASSAPKRSPETFRSTEELRLQARLQEIKDEIRKLKLEAKHLRLSMTMAHRRRLGIESGRTISLYALKLEDGCFYVGQSFNVDKRFKQHGTGKGAQWTKRHKPIEILEVRKLDVVAQDEAAKFENDMTIEYAMKYGSDVVRGGGYCQVKRVHWPAVVIQNELHMFK